MMTVIMTGHQLDRVREALCTGGAEAVFDLLVTWFREEKNYPRLFEARVMKKRHELGLPLIQTEAFGGLPPEVQQAFDQGFIEAAREVGSLFLADGEIVRAWPYFRAIGETAPVAAAIERVKAGEGVEPIIEIAFMEGVHPHKGFQLILEHHGICRAITACEQSPAGKIREKCARLLLTTLHAELVERLKRTIAQNEGQAPDTNRVPDLISGRPWLFGEHTYYVDTSHLVSVVRFTLDLEDRESLALGVELTEYGRQLSPMFQYRGDPPFENIHEDYGTYFRALLGEDVDGAVAHFRKKVEESDPESAGTTPAEVLVTLLARLKRYGEAIEVSLAHVPQSGAQQVACPTVLQLCQMAGDYGRLMDLARDRNDALHFAAGVLQA
ncbi:MAG: hypothetical protein WD696_16335 [Bryobacteraceae bacterium]